MRMWGRGGGGARGGWTWDGAGFARFDERRVFGRVRIIALLLSIHKVLAGDSNEDRGAF